MNFGRFVDSVGTSQKEFIAMAIIARTRFLTGPVWCDVRTYRIHRRDGETVAQFSIGSIDGLDVASSDRTIDCIRAVRLVAERRAGMAR